MYIIIAILIFGVLIATHELGHFTAAKLCGVRVNEFSIGMGPALLKKQKGETLYALRAFPVGGYCAMEGEDEETDDPRAFSAQSPLKRIVILIAGSLSNFLIGLLVILILSVGIKGVAGTTVVELVDGFKYAEGGIAVGDTVLSIDGHGVYYAGDFTTYMSRTDGRADVLVRRDGEKVLLKDYALQPEHYEENGVTTYRYGLTFNVVPATVGVKLHYSFYSAFNYVRLVWMSLSDLVAGRVGVKDLSGVVGIVDTINDVGESAPTKSAAASSIASLAAFIAVNLAVMNMLPIPALDGGRVFLLLVTLVIEKLIGRRVDPKYEGYIHAAGLVLLLALMGYVMFNDIAKIIS